MVVFPASHVSFREDKSGKKNDVLTVTSHEKSMLRTLDIPTLNG